MKMKKISALLAGFVLAGSLIACGNNSSDGEKKALEKVMGGNIVISLTTGNPIVADAETELSGDDNEALQVTVSQITNVDGTKYTTTLAWSWDTSYDERISLSDIEGDATHQKMSFLYPYAGDESISVEFSCAATCGKETATALFKVKLVASEIVYDAVTIQDIYKENAEGTNFDCVNEETGKIKGNHGQSFYYVTVSGKVIYKAPDSNWGLMSDGNYTMEVYRLDACSDNNNFVAGNYVTVYGEVSNGYGNIQLAYVNKIEIMADHSSIAEPVEYGELTEGVNTPGANDFKNFHCGISNRLGYVQGTLKAKVTYQDARFTFVVTIGSTDFTCAYDYHVARGDTSVSGAYQNFFSQVEAGTMIRVHGTIRWANTSSSSVINDEGAWQIAPFLATDLSIIG